MRRSFSAFAIRLFILLAASLVFTSCDECQCEPAPRAFRLLQANVGNVDGTCTPYAYNLCRIEVENNLIAGIAKISPDIVTLQEVTSNEQCDKMDESDASLVCHSAHRAVELHQARRLVGADYSIACDARAGYECVAVAVAFGTIAGCPPGELCLGLAVTSPSPEGCDDGFSVSSVVVEPHDGPPFTVVNGHPPSGPAFACRDAQLRQIFEGGGDMPALIGDGPALLSGDFNLDPFEEKPTWGEDVSLVTWNAYVGEGQRFRYHSGPAEQDPPLPTAVFLGFRSVLDHVASDFAEGVCATLGEAEGTQRLDGYDDRPAFGTDHRALYCLLTF
jgi:hypothetical protein